MKPLKHQIVIGYTSHLFAEGLECLITDYKYRQIIKKASVGKNLSTLLHASKGVDVLILEINCPKNSDIHYIHFLVEKYPFVKKLLISSMPRTRISLQLLESGIDAYLLKSCTKLDVLSALQKIEENGNYFCSEITKCVLADHHHSEEEIDHRLTKREKQVLGLLVNSRSNYQIADDLGLSENTIKTHRRNIQNKFGVNNLLGMVRYACRARLIDFGNDGYCQACPYCLD